MLPISGHEVEVLSPHVGLPQWRLRRAGDVAYAAAADLVGGRKVVLGARTGRVTEGRGKWALVFGAMPASGDRITVRFLRVGRMLRRAREVEVDPVVVGDLIWLAEAAGDFDEVEVVTGTLQERRYLDPA